MKKLLRDRACEYCYFNLIFFIYKNFELGRGNEKKLTAALSIFFIFIYSSVALNKRGTQARRYDTTVLPVTEVVYRKSLETTQKNLLELSSESLLNMGGVIKCNKAFLQKPIENTQ